MWVYRSLLSPVRDRKRYNGSSRHHRARLFLRGGCGRALWVWAHMPRQAALSQLAWPRPNMAIEVDVTAMLAK